LKEVKQRGFVLAGEALGNVLNLQLELHMEGIAFVLQTEDVA
jgi:hypothetical protein